MIVLCLFCLELLVCVALGWPIVAALLVGLVLFVGWALRQGHGLRAVGGMLWSGIRTAKNVLIVFLLIGVLTAPWRTAAGRRRMCARCLRACVRCTGLPCCRRCSSSYSRRCMCTSAGSCARASRRRSRCA
ncbi:MAG: hypothetical protein ACLR1P_11530 [Oscillospiraceae bacterium]